MVHCVHRIQRTVMSIQRMLKNVLYFDYSNRAYSNYFGVRGTISPENIFVYGSANPVFWCILGQCLNSAGSRRISDPAPLV